MNRGLVFALALVSLLAVASCVPGEYSDKFDNINVDEILGNVRLYKNFIQCFLAEEDTGCTADGKEIKKLIPEAITNGCEKCSEKQKASIKKVFKSMKNDHSDDWTKLRTKWDSENVYYDKYKSFVEN